MVMAELRRAGVSLMKQSAILNIHEVVIVIGAILKRELMPVNTNA